MAENPYLTAILAKRSERKESHPDMRDLSQAEIILLSTITQAISQGLETLSQYGSFEVASLAAAGAGATSATLETVSAIKN
jgi:hypothetical protein